MNGVIDENDKQLGTSNLALFERTEVEKKKDKLDGERDPKIRIVVIFLKSYFSLIA